MALENLYVWPIAPDWADGLLEALEWQTAVLASTFSYEQRFSTRLSPRQTVTLGFTLHDGPRTYFDLLTNRIGGSPFYMPLWHDGERMNFALPAGTTVLPLDTTYSEFEVVDAVLLWQDEYRWELHEVVGRTPIMIVMPDALTFDWPVKTRVYPVKKFRILEKVDATRHGGRAYTSSIKFQSLEPNHSAATIALNTYGDTFVLEMEPNSADDLQYTLDHTLYTIDNTTGLQGLYDIVNVPGQAFNWWCKGRAAHNELRGLLYTLAGRRVPIWVPTYNQDMVLVEDIIDASESIEVERCGLYDTGGPGPNREHICILLADGTRVYRKLIESALVGAGATERVSVDVPISPAIPLASVRRISFMARCRQDADVVELEHHTNTHGLTTAKTVFRPVRDSVFPVSACLNSFSWWVRTEFVDYLNALPIPTLDKFGNYYIYNHVPSIEQIELYTPTGVLLRAYTAEILAGMISEYFGFTIPNIFPYHLISFYMTPIKMGQYVVAHIKTAANGTHWQYIWALLEPAVDGSMTVRGAVYCRGIVDPPYTNGTHIHDVFDDDHPILVSCYTGLGGFYFAIAALPSISEFLAGTYDAGWPGRLPFEVPTTAYFPLGNNVNLSNKFTLDPSDFDHTRGLGFVLPSSSGDRYWYQYISRVSMDGQGGGGLECPEIVNVIKPANPLGCMIRVPIGHASFAELAASPGHAGFTQYTTTGDYSIDNVNWRDEAGEPLIPFLDEYTYISTDVVGGHDCYSMQIGGIQKRANGKYWVIFYMTGTHDRQHYPEKITYVRLRIFEFDPATLIATQKFMSTCKLHDDLQIPYIGAHSEIADKFLVITITEAGGKATVKIRGPIFATTFLFFTP